MKWAIRYMASPRFDASHVVCTKHRGAQGFVPRRGGAATSRIVGEARGPLLWSRVMGKGRKGSARAVRLRALLDAGDHGAARRLAAELLVDPAVTADEREEALDVRARTAPDRVVAIAG